jgi:hypothetical protein
MKNIFHKSFYAKTTETLNPNPFWKIKQNLALKNPL